MQAIVKEKRAPGLKVVSVPKPTPGPGEVLIAVRHAGVCGTDVHIADWDAWAEGRIKPPLVVGHEFAGEIVTAGDGVSELRAGQLVTAEGHIVCGHCLQCRTAMSTSPGPGDGFGTVATFRPGARRSLTIACMDARETGQGKR